MAFSKVFRPFGSYPDWLKNQYADWDLTDNDIVLIVKIKHDFVCCLLDLQQKTIDISIYNTKTKTDDFVFYLQIDFCDWKQKNQLLSAINKAVKDFDKFRDKKIFIDDLIRCGFTFSDDSDSFDDWIQQVHGIQGE